MNQKYRVLGILNSNKFSNNSPPLSEATAVSLTSSPSTKTAAAFLFQQVVVNEHFYFFAGSQAIQFEAGDSGFSGGDWR